MPICLTFKEKYVIIDLRKEVKNMREANRTKSRKGNEFQNMLFEKYVSTYDGAAYFKNNQSYHIEGLGKKISDVELELISHPNTRLIFEATTSLRDDRYWAKEVQAKLIKESLASEGKNCIYLLVVPDDTYYKAGSREIKNNRHFENLVNNEISKNHGIGAIDLFIRESDMMNFISFIDNSRFQMPSKLISVYKNKNF